MARAFYAPWRRALEPLAALKIPQRGAHSVNRRRRDRDLENCRAMVAKALKERYKPPDVVTERVKAWTDEHFGWHSFLDPECDWKLEKMVRLSLTHGWTRGMPPVRSLAWVVAQKRRVDASMVARIMLRLRTPYVAWEFFEWSRHQGIESTAVICSALLRVYCISCRQDAAMKMFRKEFKSRSELATELMYKVLVQGLCSGGYVDEAVQLFSEIPGRPGEGANSILVQGLCKNGRPGQAMELLEKLLDEKERFGVPGADAFNFVFDGLRKTRRMDHALKLFRRTPYRLKDRIAYSLLIRGFCETGKAEQAKELLWEASQRWCSLDPDLFIMVAMALRKEDEIDQALSVLERMISHHKLWPNSGTLKVFVDMLWKSGRMNREEANEAVDKICQPLRRLRAAAQNEAPGPVHGLKDR